MKAFAQLITRLDQTNKTNEKLAALEDFFTDASAADQLWMLALFTGKRPRRAIKVGLLRGWAAAEAGLPEWLFEASYGVVGDLAETISLVLPPPTSVRERSLAEWMEWWQSLAALDDSTKQQRIVDAWRGLPADQRFPFMKLITGGMRLGVSQRLVVRALAAQRKTDPAIVAHRLMGNWHPADTTLEQLLSADDATVERSKPYPFYLAHALETPIDRLAELGAPEEWQAEWKWDGIRGQLIHRDGQLFLWSRGEELITERFPEFSLLEGKLPNGTVLDGEILPYRDGAPMSFNALQTRIGRKKVSKRLIAEVPVVLVAYDLLEEDGVDLREVSMGERRERLENLLAAANHPQVIQLSPVVAFDSWEALVETRKQSRRMKAEGLMLKRRSSSYQVGRKRGDWWKWKVDPYTVDAVLVYAQRGHGRRANLYTDYTFAVWDGGELKTFTKAYSGLTDHEFREVDAFVKRNTLDKYGPVRVVKPELVFEIAFEGIAASKRHKSGIALRFPRMHRWRKDKPAEQADTLDQLKQLLASTEE